MQFDVEEPVHQVEEQDVDGNAQEPLHQSEEQQASKDTDVAAKDTDLAASTSVAAKDTDVAAALLLTDLVAATSIGTTTATSVGNTELLAAMSVASKNTDVSATLVPMTDVSATTDDRIGDGQNQDQVNHENMSSPVPTSDVDRPFRSRQLSRYLKSPYTALRFGKKQDTVEENFQKFLSEQNGFSVVQPIHPGISTELARKIGTPTKSATDPSDPRQTYRARHSYQATSPLDVHT
ncbi:hypothetical protein Dimus_033691 [Dionaea muscipula]